jgi:hypothetical protein
MLIIIAMMFLLSSCGDEVTAPDSSSPEKRIGNIEHQIQDLSSLSVEDLWLSSEIATYDEITASINPRLGGTLEGYARTWGHDYLFSIDFPAGAMSGHKNVTVTMFIPKNDGSGNPPVFKFEPDMEFNHDVTVTVHWPEWIAHHNKTTSFFCLNRNGPTDPLEVFWATDIRTASHPMGQPGTMTFTLPHFSRWGMQNGKMGDG